MATISVKCPKCREVLEVDVATGTVLRHHEEAKPKASANFLGERLRELEKEKARREAIVAEGRERQKSRPGAFDELFKKVKEESSSGKRPEKPVRDIDID